jgi:hypothetical protein
MTKQTDSCVQPAAGPIRSAGKEQAERLSSKEEVRMITARVGKEAPDFEASAFIPEVGFKNVKLSEYRGKWVALCFYPGDFTFV